MTNPADAEHAATARGANRSTRRALLGLGAVGATLAVARSASAAPADVGAFAIGVELTARDLYASADGELWSVLTMSHASYAERIAGITGVSADTRNEALHTRLADGFAASDPSAAALELENTLAATHSELLGLVDGEPLLAAIASIVAAEARHAATIADLSDAGLDATLVNTAAALAPKA